HCNSGGLATAGMGTALGVIRRAHEEGKAIQVYVDETRPLLQGARLTTWELARLGIPHTLICDNMAASLMAAGKVQKVFVGADRVAMNGDFANKIGTYGLAVAAHHHGIPFYAVAPRSTIDWDCPNGSAIPIEERAAEEVLRDWGPASSKVFNPAFDVTPANLLSGLILDCGFYRADQLAAGCLAKLAPID
ncbi:S-methyl-5-thioribose-1-phosphate isomerase, partial [bacterium]|nr:S-methyl-5-thioribose-1-phosphate isomerase [bacterium]